jgi:hypothetical protein
MAFRSLRRRTDCENVTVPGDDRQSVRIAVYEGGHSGLLRILGGRVRPNALQLAGDALVAATGDGAAGAGELAGV